MLVSRLSVTVQTRLTSSVAHIACALNHTALITKPSSKLHTFGFLACTDWEIMSTASLEAKKSEEDHEINRAASLSTDMTDSEKQIEQPMPQVTQATDWDGPNDPDNPHNWPLWLRIYHATTPGFFGFAV